MNVRVGVSLRPDREVELLGFSGLHKERKRRRVEVEIGVDVGNPAAPRLESANLDCVALAMIAVVMHTRTASVVCSRSRSSVPSIEPSETTMTSKVP